MTMIQAITAAGITRAARTPRAMRNLPDFVLTLPLYPNSASFITYSRRRMGYQAEVEW